MIPRRLKLVNFLSYRECDIDFTGIRLAVLSGRNGDGKSALLDAMTWAVWGKGRGKREDDRIRLGEGHMLVEFEFEAGGGIYRVIRKRTRGKATGQLDFFQLTDAGWTALTGGVMKDTQDEITRRVRMDYETFENSAFIAQGRADEFTKRTPAERKAVFRKILGLELYEELSKAAGDRRKEVEAESKVRRARIDEAEAVVAGLPAVLAEIAAARHRLDEVAVTLREGDAEIAELRQLAAVRQQLELQLSERRQRINQNARALERECEALENARAAVAESEKALDDEAALLDQQEELRRLRAEEAHLADALQEVRRVERKMADARAAITSEQARLEAQAKAARDEIDRQRKAAGQVESLRQAQAALDREADAIAALRAAAAEAHVQAVEQREARASAEAAVQQCKEQNRELHLKREELLKAREEGGAITCPVCRQALDPKDLAHVLDEYAAQKRELGERHAEASLRAKEAAAAAAAAEAQAARLTREADERDRKLVQDRQQCATRLGAAEEAERLLPGLLDALAGVEDLLAKEAYAFEYRQALQTAEAELAATAYDGERHEAVRARIGSLAGVETQLAGIAAARERIAQFTALAAATEGRIAALAAEGETLATAVRELEEELETAEDVGPRLRDLDSQIAAARDRQGELQRVLGGLEQQEASLRTTAAKLEEEKAQVAAFVEEAGLYAELAQAFGRDGVQAMLIAQALPRLEAIANAMLERMTNGRITVRLRTEKVNAAGKLQDTLDILIQDEAGTRDYEMYSGGEAFRVDFALRIALAKLLAERAGAELPTLIIDEGFGSQDSEGIDRLVEAITSVSEEFRLILVVTHVEEMRGRFEQRIEVTKDPERGSFARVA